MDRKTKKRIDLLNAKLQNRRQQLASARKQPDEQHEIDRLEREVSKLEVELATLRSQ